MKSILRSASSAAILVGVVSGMPAWAQTPQPPVDRVAPAAQQEEQDRVVVTGSLIAGSAEDAALPVEVFSQEDLEAQGAPTALEFAKSLTSSGPTTGESYYFAGAAANGSPQFNLRGLGADKTLTLLNGRRMSENTSNIPSAAIARVEVLKDGAATIYGADATGGVVNFITRDSFTGFEAGAQYKYIDGSDGDYGISMLGGFGEGETNFLWSVEWEHRSRLETEDRSFSSLPYHINPAPWSANPALTNVAAWTGRGAKPAVESPFVGGFSNAAGQYGSVTGAALDFTPASCTAVGGVVVGGTACGYGYVSYYNLVEESDIYKLYSQLNTTVNEHMDFHAEVSYGQVITPQIFGSPSQPATKGPGLSIGLTSQYYVPLRNADGTLTANPHALAFAQRSGFASTAAYANTFGFTSNLYRPFAHGGNPAFGEGNGFGVPSRIDNQTWRISAGIDGDLPEMFGFLAGVDYDFDVTYNQQNLVGNAPDVLGFRLQDALNGFGGPNCNAADTDPNRIGIQNPAAAGQGGCQWFNPFANNFRSQPELGLLNPVYGGAQAENSIELIKWIHDQRESEDINNNLTIDLVFSGETPLALPGGNVGLAAGGQWRQLETREVILSPFYNGATPCEWPSSYGQDPLPINNPNFNGCLAEEPGPFSFFATNKPDYTDLQQGAFFVEAQLPVLDNLNLQAAVRREDFSNGLGETVYKVAGKWDVFGPLSLRGSYGTNFQSPPAGLVPNEVNNGTTSYTRAGSGWLGNSTVTRADVVAETAKVWNVGVIWQSQGFASDHDFRLIVDYFDLETENELGNLASHNSISNGVFRFNGTTGTAFAERNGSTIAGQTADNSGAAFADCAHPLISRVSFNTGVCTQGVSRARDFSAIRTDFGNSAAQHTAGFDVQADYTMPVGPGDLGIGLTATYTTALESDAQVIDGFEIVAPKERLGLLNFGYFGGFAAAGSEVRATAHVNYNFDVHNLRLEAEYVSGVEDERGAVTPAGGLGLTTWGVDGKDWLAFDFVYLFNLTDTLRLTASVNNILDKNPPQSRQELGYDPLIGNALGRTFELGVKKTF